MKITTDRQYSCRCQNCPHVITFEDGQQGSTVECPQCHLETLLFIPHQSQIQPVRTTVNWWSWILISIALCAVVGVMAGFMIMDGTNPLLAVAVSLLICIATIGGIFFYFLPALVAWHKSKRNFTAIFVLNLCVGWTFIGWVVALVWAFTEDR